MATTFRLITKTQQNTLAQGPDNITGNTKSTMQTLGNLSQLYQAYANGAWNTNTIITVSAVAASDVITFSTISNGNTVTVNGRVYTAETSGATGAQQFNIGGSDTQAAINFAAILNADTNTAVAGVVTAVASAKTITLTSIVPGNVGLQLTASGTGGASAASANFTGGSEGASLTVSHGL